MIGYIDRVLIAGYIKSYLVCLISMLSLYVVVDLFTNLDELSHGQSGLLRVLGHIGQYYMYKVPQIFDRLCEAIVLLAAMFTIALMQRNNELLPLLSAGVPTRRIVLPILLSASLFLSLAILNQELLIPRLGNRLLTNKDDEDNQKDLEVQGAFVGNDIFIEGQTPSRRDRSIKPFFCLIRGGPVLRNTVNLSAEEAHYIPPGNGRYSGGWLMTGTHPDELDCSDSPGVLERIDPGKYFLYTPDVDFDTITRPRTWFQLTSTYQLYEELQKPDATRLSQIAVLFHMRLTRPILGVILVVLGLSVILKDQNRNVFLSAGMCLILCAVFFTALFVSRQLGDHDILSPALAAWLPVLVFGPLAFVMFDAVQT